MSAKEVRKALEKFATKAGQRAIVLKGDWGSGKTHLWNSIVTEKKEEFAHQKYCYISLFGLSNLRELRKAIFENTVPKGTANQASDVSTLSANFSNLKNKIEQRYRKVVSYGSELSVPYVKGLGSVIDSYQFASISDTLICIDDFERKGNGLSDRDVLGLISHLIETKNCSVVLILNENSLEPKSEFFSFAEKVFDYEIEFNPTSVEALDIAFTSCDEFDEHLMKNIQKLNCNNIRIIRKIQTFAEELKPQLRDKPESIVSQALLSLPLFAWAKYSNNDKGIDLDFIKMHGDNFINYLARSDDEIGKETEEEKRSIEKTRFLELYGFGYMDELDEIIMSIVRRGYVDHVELFKLIEQLSLKVTHDENVAEVRNAWGLVHDSLAATEEEIYSAFEKALPKALTSLSVPELDGVFELYEILNKTSRATEYVDDYFEALKRDGKNLTRKDVYRSPKNEYVLGRLNQHFEIKKVIKPIDGLILPNIDNNNHSRDDYTQLAKHSSDDFYNFFMRAPEQTLVAAIHYCLSFGESRHTDEETVKLWDTIFINSFEAVIRISNENLLNKYRMAQYMSFKSLYEDIKTKQV